MSAALALLLPGEPATPTGGYLYDRRIATELRALGWDVHLHRLHASFPLPTAAALDHARDTLAALPDGALTLIDGLAFGAMPGQVLAESARLRLVALVHHPLAAETGLAPALAEQLRIDERSALVAARALVVTSEETALVLQRDYGVAAARLNVIEPGVDLCLESPTRHPTHPLRLLCVATLVPRKGHALLLQALSACLDLAWTLDLVGSLHRDPDCARRVRELAGAGALQGRVHLHGELPEESVRAAYAAADLFVLASWYEGYGMAAAEALAHGLPVVATAVGAAPRQIGTDAGILVPPGDAAALGAALRRVLDDAALHARLQAGARERAHALPRWDAAAARFSACLHRVAAS